MIHLRRLGRRLYRRLLHRLLFSRVAWPRRLVRWGLRAELAQTGRGFQTAFYLRQVSPRQVGRAVLDPALHYRLIGWKQGLSPEFGFEPLFYRREAGLADGVEPYGHWLRQAGLGGAPANHLGEALPATGPRGVALLLDHARGGGSTRYLLGVAASLAADGWGVLPALRVRGARPIFAFAASGAAFDLIEDESDLVQFARAAGTTRLVINHLIDLPQEAGATLLRMADRLGAELMVVLHDYYLACPRTTLIDHRGGFCGLAPTRVCGQCLADSPDLSQIEPQAWRSRHAHLLQRASRVIAPGRDLAERLRHTFPNVRIEVVEPDGAAAPTVGRALQPGEPLTVAVLGALMAAKGAGVLLALAKVLKARGAAVEIVLIGPAQDGAALGRARVRVMGCYREADLNGLIASVRPHVILFPAIWPETWSYTLSTALGLGLPVLAFDIGEMAARLRRAGVGGVLPYPMSRQPEMLATLLTRLADSLRRDPAQPWPDRIESLVGVLVTPALEDGGELVDQDRHL